MNQNELMHMDNYQKLDADILAHHGILGMKWGVRRYQNKDGTLTNQGKKRKRLNDSQRHLNRKMYGRRGAKRIERDYNNGKTLTQARNRELGRKIVKTLLFSAGVVAVASLPDTTIINGAKMTSKVLRTIGTEAYYTLNPKKWKPGVVNGTAKELVRYLPMK